MPTLRQVVKLPEKHVFIEWHNPQDTTQKFAAEWNWADWQTWRAEGRIIAQLPRDASVPVGYTFGQIFFQDRYQTGSGHMEDWDWADEGFGIIRIKVPDNDAITVVKRDEDEGAGKPQCTTDGRGVIISQRLLLDDDTYLDVNRSNAVIRMTP